MFNFKKIVMMGIHFHLMVVSTVNTPVFRVVLYVIKDNVLVAFLVGFFRVMDICV